MQPKTILLYYPPNQRSVAIETLCLAVKDAGYELIVLTLHPKGPLHEALEKKGISTFSHFLERKQSWKYFFKQSRYLTRFCRQHRVDIVWSHLQEGNIIAVLTQPFLKTKLVTFRHHAESAFYAEFGKKFGLKRNKKEVFLDKVINRLAKRIIVPSGDVWNSMEKYEGCNMKKVLLLPYIYDFSAYQHPNPVQVNELRNTFSCKLMLIMVSRMIASKQHRIVFETVKKIIDRGMSVKMIVMDDGPLRSQLENFITGSNLQDHIIMTGFRKDFINYMAAADLLIHPSLTEASNNVVKEMGLLEKAVAVCRQVGDFSDYIEADRNGYFLERNDLERTVEKVICDAYEHPDKLKRFGVELKKDVMFRFGDSQANRQRFLDLLN
jgi:glycosyltransferase involved in cell wall biosynthesis